MRQEDILGALARTVDRIVELDPDLCLHAGDLFDQVRPLNRIMAFAAEQLHRLCVEAGIPTVIIAGNHDTPRQPHIGAPLDVFRKIDNLYVATDSPQAFRIGEVYIHAVPHSSSTDQFQRAVRESKGQEDARYNLLVVHGVAAGMPEFSMADLGEQEIPLDTLAPFDYVALGHYHNCRQVLKRAWYAGSTERLSLAERGVEKGFLEIELPAGAVRFHRIECREMVDVEEIDGGGRRGDELAQMISDRVAAIGSEDKVLRVTVTGVTEETLRTIPAQQIADLRQKAYALNIRFCRAESPTESVPMGAGAVGRLDEAFLRFLDSVELEGFDRQRLRNQALKYLAPTE